MSHQVPRVVVENLQAELESIRQAGERLYEAARAATVQPIRECRVAEWEALERAIYDWTVVTVHFANGGKASTLGKGHV